MRILFLFYTQAESGAPGFLSQRGEDTAFHCAESVSQFLENSLQVDFSATHSEREVSLAQDLSWKRHVGPAYLSAAIKASSDLFPQVLIMSGAKNRTLKTSEYLATRLALPVCVDERLDLSAADKPSTGALSVALSQCIGQWLPPLEVYPSAVLIGTSLPGLLEWLASELDTEKHRHISEIFYQRTDEDLVPTVFACGMEVDSGGNLTWIFDLVD